MADEKAPEGQAPPQRELSHRELRAKNDALARENEALRRQLVQEKASQGPAPGTPVCYQRAGEGFCRPASIKSEGFTELLKHPSGVPQRHALLEYREAPWTTGQDAPDHMKAHSFETDRPWDSLGRPETWHLPDECPRQRGAGCPYSSDPHWPARPSKLDSVEAP